jgi:S1-C subfamily serine protease
MYEKGQGVPRDDKTAVKWSRLAAKQGLSSAQYNLFVMLANGRGIPKDYIRAYMWASIAASSGHKDAIKSREVIAKAMTPSQITKAQKLARNFLARKNTQTASSIKPSPNTQTLVPASSGSGFAVSSDGHIITNYHVIQGCQRVKIHFNGKSIPITLLAFDPRNDLALLAGNFRPTIVLPLSTSSPKLLQDVYVAGFPFGRNISTGVKVTKGIISSLMGAGNNFVNIQIDAALQPGNSGGPILDDKGNVVGVAVSILDKQKTLKKFGSSSENSNFGIKVLLVKSMLEVNNISSPAPNKTPISRSELGKIIYSGTYYLSCWMTTEQIKKTRSKKLEFQNAK